MSEDKKSKNSNWAVGQHTSGIHQHEDKMPYQAPVSKPFSIIGSPSYALVNDDLDDEGVRPHDIRQKEGETKAERRSRLAGIYARGVADAEEAEHSHNLPIHQPFSLAHTYDHAATQLEDEGEDNRAHDIRQKEGETKAERKARMEGVY